MLTRIIDRTIWTTAGALAIFLIVAGLTHNPDRSIEDMNAEIEREREWREAYAQDRYLHCLDTRTCRLQ